MTKSIPGLLLAMALMASPGRSWAQDTGMFPGAAPAAPPPGAAAATTTAPAPTPAAPQMKRRSKALMVIGIVFTFTGLIPIGAGAALVAAEQDEGPAPLIAIGAGTVATGIPLWIIGGGKVPVEPETASAVPSVKVAPGSASLSWRF